jgi:hypothetical protein
MSCPFRGFICFRDLDCAPANGRKSRSGHLATLRIAGPRFKFTEAIRSWSEAKLAALERACDIQAK